MKSLQDCRAAIDRIDAGILELLSQRLAVARDIADCKLSSNQPILDRVREQDKLKAVMEQAAAGGLPPLLVADLFTVLMARTVSYEQGYLMEQLAASGPERDSSIAYLGTTGTYSHLAAHRFLDGFRGRLTACECGSFEEIVACVESLRAEYGILPIENSSSGNINEVLDLLQLTRCSIVGELFYPIDHSILALQDQPLTELTELCSHTQPVTQCSRWLHEHLPQVRITFTSSSSAAMQQVVERGDPHVAAIGSAGAIRFYPLHSLISGISNNPDNHTRFIVIAMTPVMVPSCCRAKTSLSFSVPKYRPGSLIDVLSAFSAYRINLTKLISRPSGSDHKDTWEEMFFADVEANLSDLPMQDILNRIRPLTTSLKILGCYCSGEDGRGSATA